MNALMRLELVQTTGVVLAHFLWQGATIAIILVVALRVLRAPTLRYAAATMAMLTLAICPLITVVAMSRQPRVPNVSAINVAQLKSPVVIDPPISPATSANVDDASTLWMTVLVSLWFIGVAAMGTRHVVGWLQLCSARAAAEPIAADEWTAPLSRMIDALGVKAAVQLAATTRFDSAVAFGVFKPIILVPVSLLSGLNAAQIELILAHELAHIRRRDYLMNLLQTAVETILFYHPAVWWVGAVMRREREYCCDDLAAAACGGDRRAYASSLLQLEVERGQRFAHTLAPAVAGASVLHRARRLMQSTETPRGVFGGVFAIVLVLSCAALAIAKASTSAERPESANAPTTSPSKVSVYYLGGNVKRPGVYTLAEPLTLADAIDRADGFADGATRIRVDLPNSAEIVIDLKSDGWKADPKRGGFQLVADARIRVSGDAHVSKARAAAAVDDPDWEKTYRIGRFDLLNIRVTSKDGATPPANHEARVPESGKVALADVKVDVNAMGLTTRELTDTLLAALRQGNLNVNVDVKIAEARGNTFIATGMVGRPGEYVVALGKKLRLSEALRMTGLLNEAKVITILSKNGAGSKVIATYDAGDFRKSSPPVDDPVIEPGQVIFAGERSPEATQPATNRAPAQSPTTSKADARSDNAPARQFTMEDLATTDPMMRFFLENRSKALFNQVKLTQQFGAAHPSVVVAQREFNAADRMAQEYFTDKKPK